MTARTLADLPGAVECVRCQRSEDEHLLRDRDQADDIQARIWKALGWPCAEFTGELAAVFAANQAGVSRWSRGRPPAPSPAAVSAPSVVAARGAAAARQALARRHLEAS